MTETIQLTKRLSIEKDADPDEHLPSKLLLDGVHCNWLRSDVTDELLTLTRPASNPGVPGMRAERSRRWPDADGLYGVLVWGTAFANAHIWFTSKAEGDAAIAAINGTPGEALPPGVHRAPDGTLLAKGADIPDTWRRRHHGGTGGSWSIERDTGPVTDARYSDCWYEVRPAPAAPATVKVPVDLALIGRKLPTGDTITQYTVRKSTELDEAAAPGGIYVEMFLNGELWANPDRLPDGTVEVLPLPEDEEGQS